MGVFVSGPEFRIVLARLDEPMMVVRIHRTHAMLADFESHGRLEYGAFVILVHVDRVLEICIFFYRDKKWM
jgi:hypothetical protein